MGLRRVIRVVLPASTQPARRPPFSAWMRRLPRLTSRFEPLGATSHQIECMNSRPVLGLAWDLEAESPGIRGADPFEEEDHAPSLVVRLEWAHAKHVAAREDSVSYPPRPGFPQGPRGHEMLWDAASNQGPGAHQGSGIEPKEGVVKSNSFMGHAIPRFGPARGHAPQRVRKGSGGLNYSYPPWPASGQPNSPQFDSSFFFFPSF